MCVCVCVFESERVPHRRFLMQNVYTFFSSSGSFIAYGNHQSFSFLLIIINLVCQNNLSSLDIIWWILLFSTSFLHVAGDADADGKHGGNGDAQTAWRRIAVVTTWSKETKTAKICHGRTRR